MKRTRLELAVGFSCLAAFFVITSLVVSGLSQISDLGATLQVNGYDLGPVGTYVMVWLTDHGRELVWGLVVVATFLIGNKRTKLLAIELALLFIIGIIVGDVLKPLIDRLRPDDSRIIFRVPAETDPFAYPSGHALIVSIGGAFSAAMFRHKLVSGLLCVEAALVCYSRIYVGVHYALDVVGGILLGVAFALIGAFVVEKYLRSVLERLLEPMVAVMREGPLDV